MYVFSLLGYNVTVVTCIDIWMILLSSRSFLWLLSDCFLCLFIVDAWLTIYYNMEVTEMCIFVSWLNKCFDFDVHFEVVKRCQLISSFFNKTECIHSKLLLFVTCLNFYCMWVNLKGIFYAKITLMSCLNTVVWPHCVNMISL